MTRNFLHRVFPGPLFGQLLVLRLVRFVQSGIKVQIKFGNTFDFNAMKIRYLAISGTRGSSGLGSQSKEQIESNTFEMVSAGDH